MATTTDTRRRELAVAVFRTIDRLGVERASLREIARDAGVTTGSLTHHFADRRALLDYAFGLLIDDVTARSITVARDEGLAAGFAEYLPLDDRRRLEGLAWLVSIPAARRDPVLAASLARRYATARELLAGVLASRLADRGDAPSDDELDLLVDELITGLDGITVYALADPERYPPARQLALAGRVLRRVGLED